MRKNAIFFLLPFIFVFGTITTSLALPLDLSSWDAWGPVTISSDGFSATLYEDSGGFGPTSLENWGLDIPNDAISLSFNYSLTIAPSNEDYFDFYFSDTSTPVFSAGESNITDIADVISGSFSFSLAGLEGSTVPVIFALQWGFGDLGYESYLAISNVEISTEPVIPVPEPATILLLATGLVGLMARRKH